MNMKKRFLTLVLATLSIAIISCTSCAHPSSSPPSAPPAPTPCDAAAPVTDDEAPTPTPAPSNEPLSVNVNSCSFILPKGGAWEQEETGSENVVVYNSSEFNCKVVLIEKSTKGAGPALTTQGLSVLILQSMKEAGGKIESVKQVTINGKKMIFITSHAPGSNPVTIYSWLVVANGNAYNLNCGGITSPVLPTLCQEVANTFTIK